MRCKKGELAFIVGGFVENISKVVAILAPSTTFPDNWLVISPNKNLISQHQVTGVKSLTDKGRISDGCLSPIRGLSKKEIDEILAKDKERHV